MITLDTIRLPDDLIWTNEFSWTAIAQSSNYSLSGALVIEECVKQSGRLITLSLPSEYGDCERSVVLSLFALSQQRLQHTLTLHDGREFIVRFNHTDGPAVSGSPVVGYADPAANDQYALELKFIEVLQQ